MKRVLLFALLLIRACQQVEHKADGLPQQAEALVRLYTRTGDAQKLYLSVHTVNTHRQRIYSKMDVKNVSDMLRWATELGII